MSKKKIIFCPQVVANTPPPVGCPPVGVTCPPVMGAMGSCFLGNSLVRLADGTNRQIIDLKIGDKVKGAYEINTIIGMYKTVLGERKMYVINGNHYTTDEHPHMTSSKQFRAINPEATINEYDQTYLVEIVNGKTENMKFVGLPKDLLFEMKKNDTLLTETGPEIVKTIKEEDFWDKNTPVYNPIVDGSGTLMVDGYVTTGWPNHEKFDFYNWKPK